MVKLDETPEFHAFIIRLPGIEEIKLAFEGPLEYGRMMAEKWMQHYHGLGPKLIDETGAGLGEKGGA